MGKLEQAIGNTNLIKLKKLSAELGASIYAKYEAANPGASIKDRAALSMIDEAEARGEIASGKTVLVEPTSGNTGIAIAMIGAARGYEVVLTMPESMSRERRVLLAAYGAELVLTPAAEGMAGAVARADEIVAERPGAWLVGQFSNPDNPIAHERTTGPEIAEALGGAPDFIVAAAGTGGTISGLAHYFKKVLPAAGAGAADGAAADGASADEALADGAAADEFVEPAASVSAGAPVTRCYAVEPTESPIITQALAGEELTPGAHGIQGIGPNFIPETLDLAALDGTLLVSTDEALAQARWLATQEGLLVGISSGANIAAVRKLLQEHPEAQGSRIVTIAVDTGERYLSTELFEGIV